MGLYDEVLADLPKSKGLYDDVLADLNPPKEKGFVDKAVDFVKTRYSDSPDLKPYKVKNEVVLNEQEQSDLAFKRGENLGNVAQRKGKFGTPISNEISPAEKQVIESDLTRTQDPIVKNLLNEQLTRPTDKTVTQPLTKRQRLYLGNQPKELLIGNEYLSEPASSDADFGGVVKGLVDAVPQGLEATRQGIRSQYADAIGNESMSEDAQKMAMRNRSAIQDSTPKFETATAQGLYGGASSLIQQIPSLAASIATGNPLPALLNAGLTTEAEAYTRYKERGANPMEALTGAIGEGAVEVITEKLPMKFLVDKFGKVGATKFIAGFIAKDALPEQVATLAQDAIDTAIANPDKTWGDYLTERPDAAYQTLLATVVQGGVMGGASAGARKLFGDSEIQPRPVIQQPQTRGQRIIAELKARQQGTPTTAPNADADLLNQATAYTGEAINAADLLEGENVSDTNTDATLVAGINPQSSDNANGSIADSLQIDGSGQPKPSIYDSAFEPEQGNASDMVVGAESNQQNAALNKTPDNPTPEPKATIDAQTQAFIEGNKPALLITQGEALPDNLPNDVKTAEIPNRGTLVYRDDQSLQQALDGKMGEALGYGIDEKPAQAKEVVTARDVNGTVIQDVATDGRQSVVDAAKQVAGNGTVEVRPIEQAIAERESGKEVEPDYANLNYEQLNQLRENGIKRNKELDISVIRKYAGNELANEALNWPQRKIDKWFNENATGEMEQESSAFKGVNTEKIDEYAKAVTNFDETSPQTLGASIALKMRDISKPDFIGSPEGLLEKIGSATSSNFVGTSTSDMQKRLAVRAVDAEASSGSPEESAQDNNAAADKAILNQQNNKSNGDLLGNEPASTIKSEKSITDKLKENIASSREKQLKDVSNAINNLKNSELVKYVKNIYQNSDGKDKNLADKIDEKAVATLKKTDMFITEQMLFSAPFDPVRDLKNGGGLIESGIVIKETGSQIASRFQTHSFSAAGIALIKRVRELNKIINSQEKSTDLLGNDTTKQQALADAERAKDAKRNTGNDNADGFTLTGSNNEADTAAANGAQDLFASNATALAAIKASDDITKSEKIKLAADLRKGDITAENVTSIVGEPKTDGASDALFSRNTGSSKDELIDAVKTYFGTTLDKNEAGYILPDGTMLDFAGRHQTSKDNWKYMRGERATDHREFFGENIHNRSTLNGLIKSNDGNDAMREFMSKTGAMRVDFTGGVASIMQPPTAKQVQLLGNGNKGEYLAISYVDAGSGRIVDEVELESANATKVKQFFDAAIDKPVDERAPLFSRTKAVNIDAIRGKSTALDNGNKFETGQPVTFNFAHNTESATKLWGKPKKDSAYGRGYEPAGEFVTAIGKLPSDENKFKGMEYGTISFTNPLVIDNDGLQWKKKLSEDYGGLTGKKLSIAVIQSGFDGIVTTENGHASEIINLQTFDESKALYSRTTATKKTYESRIDELFNDKKPNYGLKSAIALDKSDVLDMLGYGEKPLYLNEGKVIQGLEKHPNMTADVWKKVPEWIENPALVFDSDDKIARNVGRLVFVAPEQINNNPVLIIIEPNADEKGIKVDVLVNAYDKDTSYPPIRSWVEDKDLLRYYNKAKSPAILARSGLQLSSLARARSSSGKILRDSDLVKYRAQNNPVLSRSNSDGFGLPIYRGEEILADIAKKYKKFPRVALAQSVNEFPIDDALKSSEGGEIEGMYYQGTIYINMGAIYTEERFREVFAHEDIGHLAVETMLDEVDPKLMPKLIRQVQLLDKGGNKYIREIAARVDISQPSLIKNEDYKTRAKEIIAKIAEMGDQDKNMTPVVRSIWQKLIDGIKAFGKLVFGVDMNDQDVRDIVSMAARYARGEDVVSMVRNSDALFSKQGTESAPIFYSQLSRAFANAKQEAMPAAQWAAWIKGNAAQLGVKADEVEWSGINEWLALQTGKVGKADILEYLDGNGVQVSETMLGSSSRNLDAEWDAAADAVNDAIRNRLPDAEQDRLREIRDSLHQEILDENRGFVATKYSQYVVAGGSNYKELLLTLPDTANEQAKERIKKLSNKLDTSITEAEYKAAYEERRALTDKYLDRQVKYKSSHFDQANILAHVRFDERTDADGKRVLFINEVQSDWGQEGKKKGFANEAERTAIANEIERIHGFKIDRFTSVQKLQDAGVHPKRVDAWDKAFMKGGDTPSAPFVTDTKAWVALAIKRMTRYAVDNGFDKVAFISGEQAAGLYDLSKQVDSITAIKLVNGYTIRANKDGGRVMDKDVFSDQELESAVGKDLAKKINKQEIGVANKQTYSGDNLRIGGEGMRAFYDKIVPQVVNDVLKKVGGGKVESIELPAKQRDNGNGWGSTDEDVTGHNATTQAGFTITPTIRDKVAGGLPMFSRSTTPQQQGVKSQPNAFEIPQTSKLDNVLRSVQDKNIDLKRVTANIKKKIGDISDNINAYLQEELYHGRAAKRTKDFLNNELNPLITAMQTRGVTMADFEEYLWARHAEERNIQIAKVNPDMPDGGSGLTTAEANDYLNGLSEGKKRSFEALAKRVDAITQGSRQVLVDYNLESASTVTAMEGAYKNYVPLMREDMDNGFGQGTGQGFSVKGNSGKRATGSNRAVVDILANIAQQRERNIIRGEKNRVATALFGLAKTNPNKDFWDVDTPPKVKTVSKVTGLVEEYTDPNYKNRDNVVVARIADKNGNIQERSVVFNERNERAVKMAKNIKNLDQDQLGVVLSNAAMITRYFSSINTQYNPMFGVVNIMRDVQGALLNLSSTPLKGMQAQVLAETAKTLRPLYKEIRAIQDGKSTNSETAKLYQDFQREGGQTGYQDMFRNAEERGKAIEKTLDPKWWQTTKLGKVVSVNGLLAAPEQWLMQKPVKLIFDWLSDYNEALENTVRLATYKVGLEKGLSKQQAASVAKNISVNFNRKGTVGSQMGSLYAFFNASVQGSARIAETIMVNDNGKISISKVGKQIIGGGMLLGAVQAVAMAMADFDDEEPPEYIRDRNIIIPLSGGKYIAIPMPLGFNAIPATGRIMTEWVLSGGENTGGIIVHLLDVILNVTNPIGNAGLSMQTVAPTLLDPLAALTENKDFTGRKIAREDMNSKNPTPGYTRAKDTASGLSTGIAYFINSASDGNKYTKGAISPTPDQLDYLIGQVTGGVGREGTKIISAADSLYEGEEIPNYKIPLAGKFYGNAKNNDAERTAYYDNIVELNKIENELKGRITNKDGVAEFRENNPLVKLIARANDADKSVTKLVKQRRNLERIGATKERIKQTNELITLKMKRLNEAVREIEAEK